VDDLFRRAERQEGYRLTVDLEAQTVSDENGLNLKFEIDPFRRECLLKGLDDIGLSLRFADKIAEYERGREPGATMYEKVDAV